jgi:hypothetical protein
MNKRRVRETWVPLRVFGSFSPAEKEQYHLLTKPSLLKKEERFALLTLIYMEYTDKKQINERRIKYNGFNPDVPDFRKCHGSQLCPGSV